MKKLFINLYKNKTVLTWVSLFVFICSILFMYRLLNQTRFYVEFDKLRPFHEKAPVYFKGYKIGKVVKIQPDNNYQNTLVTIVLKHNDAQLPINTTAHLKMHKTKWMHRDYIDLIYPENPDSTLLKRGSKIKGKSSIDIHSYLSNISHDSYEKMEKNAAGILENLNDTTGMLYSIFALINGILSDSEDNIKTTIQNFTQTSKNTSQLFQKIDNSLTEEQLKNTINNIYDTTAYAKKTLYHLNEPASQTKQIVGNIDKTLFNTNCLMNNINEVVCGVKHTMKKRFSGLRLLFGRIIS